MVDRWFVVWGGVFCELLDAIGRKPAQMGILVLQANFSHFMYNKLAIVILETKAGFMSLRDRALLEFRVRECVNINELINIF